MSLPHALLTSLAERPGSGSDLAGRFDRSIGYFWHATHQQIYRELARMAEAGWIESLPEESTRGRKRAYRLLPAGRKELKRWIALGGQPAPLRDELMVRLWADAAVGPAGLAKDVRQRLQLHQDMLARYQAMERREAPPAADDRAAALRRLVLQAGLRYERYWIELLLEALKTLDPAPGAADAA
ncbi:MAG: PadR family transcriptional regulator [Proteobacteria bacterium]|nr:PadR family transcriptional regulator [Pseudomonadota bacterium]